MSNHSSTRAACRILLGAQGGRRFENLFEAKLRSSSDYSTRSIKATEKGVSRYVGRSLRRTDNVLREDFFLTTWGTGIVFIDRGAAGHFQVSRRGRGNSVTAKLCSVSLVQIFSRVTRMTQTMTYEKMFCDQGRMIHINQEATNEIQWTPTQRDRSPLHQPTRFNPAANNEIATTRSF